MNRPKLKEARVDARLMTLTALLQLQDEARRAENLTELGFIAVNETHRLIPYQQAVLWGFGAAARERVQAVSGVTELDRNAPYIVWLTKLARHLSVAADGRQQRSVGPGDIPDSLKPGWQEWVPGSLMWSPLIGPDQTLLGGLMFLRAEPFEEAEQTLLGRLVPAYAYSYSHIQALSRHTLAGLLRRVLPGGLAKPLLLAGVIGCMFIPLRLSVLAPAEVIASDPTIISSPVEGVIKRIHVAPNSPIKAGDALFSLDDTALGSRLQVAQKALAVARADYLRAQQKAFTDVASKSELARLAAVVDEKIAEVDYTARLLNRINVRSDRDGIAVFADANDWIGKPVTVGERVMTIADPGATELQAWIAVGDAINLEPGAEVSVFLNIDPTHPVAAELYQTSYDAEKTPEGGLAFRIKARFSAHAPQPRIGLKGTAKVYGEQVSFAYWLMRRPLAAARQFVGL